MRILIVGGSKSGKSHLAQQLTRSLASGGRAYYWATMEPTDREDAERIEKHIEDRAGWGFETIERGRALTDGPMPEADSSVLFDSVTALLANEMFFGQEPDPTAPLRALRELIVVSKQVRNFVCVCDEVFRDGFEYGDWTDEYVRGLAGVCRGLASVFDAVYEAAAGIIKVHKGLPFEV